MVKSKFRYSIIDILMMLCAVAIVVILVTSLCGCMQGLRDDVIVRHPDAPMLIEEVSGSRARVAIYNAETNKLIEYGWVDLQDLPGWTLKKFDWQKFLGEQQK